MARRPARSSARINCITLTMIGLAVRRVSVVVVRVCVDEGCWIILLIYSLR